MYQAENAVHRDSAIETFFQCGMQGTHPNMLLELLCQIFAEPAFDELRTKVRQLFFFSPMLPRRKLKIPVKSVLKNVYNDHNTQRL